jgi:hypothetical protein
MKRIAIWTIAVAVVAAPVIGAAATLGVDPGILGAGSADVAPCDTTGFSETYTTSGGNVTSVAISDIADPTCEGGELSLTITNAAGVSIGGGGAVTIPTDGDTAANSVNVPVVSGPFAGNVARLHISIVGP